MVLLGVTFFDRFKLHPAKSASKDAGEEEEEGEEGAQLLNLQGDWAVS